MFCIIQQVSHAAHCQSESDAESQRALETVQRAADSIIREKDKIIEW